MCRRAEMSDVLHAIIVSNGTTGYSVENILRRMKERFFCHPFKVRVTTSHNKANPPQSARVYLGCILRSVKLAHFMKR